MVLQDPRVEFLYILYSKYCQTFDSIERIGDDGDFGDGKEQRCIFQMRQIDYEALSKLSGAMFGPRLPYLAGCAPDSYSCPRFLSLSQSLSTVSFCYFSSPFDGQYKIKGDRTSLAKLLNWH